MAVRFDSNREANSKITLREGTVLDIERVRRIAASARRSKDDYIAGICEDLLERPDATIIMLNHRLMQNIGQTPEPSNNVRVHKIGILVYIGVDPNHKAGGAFSSPYQKAIDFLDVKVVDIFAKSGATLPEHVDLAREKLSSAMQHKDKAGERKARRIFETVQFAMLQKNLGIFPHLRRDGGKKQLVPAN